MYDKEIILEILDQIIEAVIIVKRRCEFAKNVDDFLDSDTGKEKLDSICMKLIAVGESLKKIDKVTDKNLLKNYPDIEWKKIIGIRDFISHHYFDLDAEIIFDICQNHINNLIETLQTIKSHLEKQ